jgi:hypothetical protein
MNKELTKIEQRDLHDLAKQINDRQQAIQKSKGQAFIAIGSTLTEAVLQGHDLIKAKAMVPHGLFMEWIKVNCPTIGYVEATRYMKLAANIARVKDLDEAGSIRAALLLCEQAEINAGERPAKQWVPYLEGLYRFGKAVKFLRDEPVDQWPAEGQEQLRTELEPVAMVLWPERFA